MTGNTIPNFSNLGFLRGEQQERQRVDQDRAEGSGTHAHTGLKFEPGARFRTHRETLFTARSLPPVRGPGMTGDREAGGREGSSDNDEEEGRPREQDRWTAEEGDTRQRRTEETIVNLRKVGCGEIGLNSHAK
ncbi:hypothetical protein J3R30DRAFT_3708153 [Lentinula aciculospora]|uniref:Uncharacterized protein n=1 Tax=Lentinula aciculospora TaxID=153920 RepID=A0A9W9A367_9AGAR|nr:hypothetical protein J3R30DRAFT_3708153 [Lentinula aciculospora]